MRILLLPVVIGLSAACRDTIKDGDGEPLIIDETDIEDPDAPDPVVERVGPAVGVVSGTGTGTSPNYRATVVVGGPTSQPTVTSPNHAAKVGIGVVQPVQEAP